MNEVEISAETEMAQIKSKCRHKLLGRVEK